MEASVTTERRQGERRKAEDFGKAFEAACVDDDGYVTDRRRYRSDRRSPGGAGLADQSQARGSVGVGIIMGVGTGAAPHDVAQNVSCILSVCAACGGALDLRDHGWRERPGMLRIAVCRACEVDGTPLAEAASTPPHEQQNEPSSSPARAPGDEPAEPWVAWVDEEIRHQEWRASESVYEEKFKHQYAADLLKVTKREILARVGRAEREPRTSEHPNDLCGWCHHPRSEHPPRVATECLATLNRGGSCSCAGFQPSPPMRRAAPPSSTEAP